jgi:hypothetical protein
MVEMRSSSYSEIVGLPEGNHDEYSANEVERLFRSAVDGVNEDDFLDTDENVDYRRVEVEEDRRVGEVVERLLCETGRFRSIFRTERGSVYFVMPDGKAIRVKRATEEGRTFWSVQPATDHIVFLDERIAKTVSEWIHLGGRQWFLERNDWDEPSRVPREIPTVPLAPRAIPFEIGIAHDQLEYVVKEDSGFVRIIRTRHRETKELRDILGGIHLGHPVSEVLKA